MSNFIRSTKHPKPKSLSQVLKEVRKGLLGVKQAEAALKELMMGVVPEKEPNDDFNSCRQEMIERIGKL